MRLVKTAIIFLSFALAGCSYVSSAKNAFNAHDKDYLSAQSIPPLKIPPGIGSSAFQNLYPIPDRQYAANTERVSVVPPGLMEKN